MSNPDSYRISGNVVSFFDYVQSQKSQHKLYGEQALKGAPTVELAVRAGQHKADSASKIQAVPQQFLEVSRTLESLEAILADVEFDPNYPYFAGKDGDTLYIQAGIIGVENYPGCKQPLNSPKIVYGRKWLIETATPSSEVIQTVFLATQKAREHEIREHFYLLSEDGLGRSTPFNTHMDLPLMARLEGWQEPSEQLTGNSTTHAMNQRDAKLHDLLRSVRFGSVEFELTSLTQIQVGCEVAIVRLNAHNALFPEFNDANLAVVFDGSHNHFLHGLIEAMIQCSNQHVCEHFTYKGFARFSKSVSVKKVGEFSVQTRKVGELEPAFRETFRAMNSRVDSERAPRLNKRNLGRAQLEKINRFTELDGYVPQ